MPEPRNIPPFRNAEERKRNFEEVNLGFDRETAVKEASRCLQCKNPHQGMNCMLIFTQHVRTNYPLFHLVCLLIMWNLFLWKQRMIVCWAKLVRFQRLLRTIFLCSIMKNVIALIGMGNF